LSEDVSWKAGDEIVVSTSSFESRDQEIFKIKSIANDKQTITMETAATHVHKVVEVSLYKVPVYKNNLSKEAGKITFSIKNVSLF